MATTEMFSEDVTGQSHLAVKANRIFNCELDFCFLRLIQEKNKWTALNIPVFIARYTSTQKHLFLNYFCGKKMCQKVGFERASETEPGIYFVHEVDALS